MIPPVMTLSPISSIFPRAMSKRLRILAGVAALVGAAILAPSFAAPVAAAAAGNGSDTYPKLFGSSEIRSSKLAKFRKWTDTLKRYRAERLRERGKCRVTRVNRCRLARWRSFLRGLDGAPPRVQIERVNRYLNKLFYIVDPVNYGVKDYWATPGQFFSKNGDCEDYAIAKYMSLRDLGFAVKDMRIVVLRDTNLKIAHAVLVVYFHGEPLVLDNQISQVVNANRIRHYKPIYSINESNWWLHRG